MAQAKAHLSALLDAVESGENVEITRRGVPVARLTRASERLAAGFDLDAFLAATTNQCIRRVQCRPCGRKPAIEAPLSRLNLHLASFDLGLCKAAAQVQVAHHELLIPN